MQTKSPTLSIITINRNNAEGLRKTMGSVLSQNCDDFEYIIIDGASTDASVEVIKEFLSNPNYAKKITYWVSEKDSGLYNALNKGISHAQGKLIGLMHSGDWYLPDVFFDVKKIHEKHPASVLYGALKAIKDDKFESIWGKNVNILPQEMIPHLSTFVPKALYDKCGLFNEEYKIAADYDLFLRFYTSQVDFFFVDKIFCCFNLEGISQTNDNVKIETDNIKKKYGFYKVPTNKQKIVNLIKKIIHW